jgi:hypothetical protein
MERAYAGPTLCFLAGEGMRWTRMPITEFIVWLQAEQKAEARKRQQLQKRKRERLQKQPRLGDRRREVRDPLLASCHSSPGGIQADWRSGFPG